MQILIGIEALCTRASDFDHIFSTVATPSTGRFPGLLIWMKTHPDFEPWGILIKRNDNVVAAAILTRYRKLGLWLIGKPGGVNDPVRFGALDDDAAARLAQAICDAAQGFGGPWRLEYSDLPSPDPVVNHLLSIWPHCQTQSSSPIPCLQFAPDAPLNQYLSSNTRAAVAKARNRIKRENVQIAQEWTRNPERIRELLPQILNIYCLRDHQLYGKSLIDDRSAENFFLMFVAEHANQGMIDLLTIHLNGQLAAFALCLLDIGEHWVLVNRASPDWLHYSPGTIANAEVVRHAFEDPHSHGVNWGGAPQRYKLSGEVTLIPRQTLYAWSSATVRIFLQYRRRVVSLLKSLMNGFKPN